MILTQEYSRVMHSKPMTSAVFDSENRPSEYKNYYDIGHDTGWGPYLLWVWTGGEILTSQIYGEVGEDDDDENPLHSRIWSYESDNTFCGRFETKTRELSVRIPERWQHRSLPEVLLESLERKFHPKNIHVY